MKVDKALVLNLTVLKPALRGRSIEVARALDMRDESLSRKINGQLNITLRQINELAKLLEIEPIDLLQEVKDELYRG